jgi:capsular exopolysaccharide synthesis family protein
MNPAIDIPSRDTDEVLEPGEIDLRSYWQTLKKRRLTILATIALVLGLTALLTFTQQPVYEAQTKILAKRDRSSQATDLLSSTVPALGAFADQRDIQTEVQIIRSWPLQQEAARAVGVELPASGKSPVKVEGGKDDNVITVTARSTDPAQATRLADKIAEVYVAWNQKKNRSSARAGREFLEGQERRYAEALERAAAALRDYQKRTVAVDLDAATEGQVKLLTDLEAERTRARTEEAAAAVRVKRLREALGSTDRTIVSSRTIERNPAISKVQDEIADLTAQRAALLRDYAPGSAKVQALDAQLASLRERQQALVSEILAGRQEAVNPLHQSFLTALTEAEAESLSQAARIQGISEAIARQQNLLRALPDQQYELARLQRNVQIAEKTYLALQERYQSLRIAEESTLANAQIIEWARTPEHPVSPKKKLNLVLGLLVGVMLGVGLAALQEALDDKLHDTEDVERLLGLPLLGLVGRIPEPSERSLRLAGPSSRIAEAFRLVRSNVKFLAVDRPLRSVMVTSATTGEGKSTTAANLAVAMAQDGRRVVLVDGDLRRPTVHKHFDLPNDTGLTNVIAAGASLADTLVTIPDSGLSVLPSGPIPPNPAELLDSGKFGDLLGDLARRYDMVVFDAPPVLGMADAAVLGAHADGVVMVIAAGEVEKSAVSRALQMLRQARANVLGAVLNKHTGHDGGYYYYYYYYDSGNKTISPESNGNMNGNGRRRSRSSSHQSAKRH